MNHKEEVVEEVEEERERNGINVFGVVWISVNRMNGWNVNIDGENMGKFCVYIK